MSGKACDGDATIPCGDMEECADCGTRIRFDLVDDKFWGFQNCREKSVTALLPEAATPENAGATPVCEGATASAHDVLLYLRFLHAVFPDGYTDEQAAAIMEVDRTSINARRGPLVNAGLVEACGSRVSKYDNANTIWRLRLPSRI